MLYVTQSCYGPQVNTAVDNIGARRLHTVLERIVEDISFEAPDKVSIISFIECWVYLLECCWTKFLGTPKKIVSITWVDVESVWSLSYFQVKEVQQNGQGYKYVVDKKDVKERVGELLKRQDLSKYVL